MFYQIEQGQLTMLPENEVPRQGVRVGYLDLAQLQKQAECLALPAAIVRDCAARQDHPRSGVDLYDDFTFGVIDIVDVSRPHAARDRIAIFIRQDLFLLVKLVDADDSVRAMFAQAVQRYRQSATLEKVIFGVLDVLLAGGAEAAAREQHELQELERVLVEGSIDKELNRDIFALRARLSAQKNYYDQLAGLGEELAEDGNDIFAGCSLRYFKIFADKAVRLSRGAQNLSENAIHLREALAAAQDYELNRVMKVFTVVTTIFLPLTLIVGWYGMNFRNMPELEWVYGYPAVIGTSIAVVVVCVAFFKKRRLM